jgi:hypothetical protein
VISDLDIWRAANLMIGRLGVDAELEADRMADVMRDRSDMEGQRVWRRIRRAIVELPAQPKGKRIEVVRDPISLKLLMDSIDGNIYYNGAI